MKNTYLYSGMITLIKNRILNLTTATLFVLAFLPACILSEDLHPKKTTYIRDSLNRIVIYHGVCVSNYSKHSGNGSAGLPWHGKKDFDRLKQWGFNLVRYMMFWEAIEPSCGSYNEEYIRATVQKLSFIDADVVIDMHQDLYCHKFGGNGFPEWSVHDGGKKFKHRRPWSLAYLEPAVKNAYSFFWKDSALQSSYIAMLKRVLTAADTITNVVAIDVMNEPFNGFAPGFERKTLSAFYERIAKAAAEIGFKKMIFFEPQMYASGGLSTSLSFKPGGTWVYAPHYYDPFCHEGRPYGNFNRNFLRKRLAVKVKEASKFGTPMVLGEFGISPGVPGFLSYLKDLADFADQNRFGWVYYSYDRVSDEEFGIVDGHMAEQPNMKALMRVYPQKIAGDNPVFRCDTGRFTLEFDAAGNGAPTEIFIPARCKNVKIKIDGKTVETQIEGKAFSFISPASRKRIEITWD